MLGMEEIQLLTLNLEIGGFESFFRGHGEEAMHYFYVIEEMCMGDNIEMPALFWEAMIVAGYTNAWNDKISCLRALDALTATDRAQLQHLTAVMLNCIYNYDFILDC